MSSPSSPRLPVGERLRRAGVAAWSLIGIVLLVLLLLKGLVYVKVIFPPLALAVLIIYLLNPLISRLEERGVRRSVGTLLSYVVVLGGITLVLIVTIPYIGSQVEDFSDRWPEFRAKTINFIEDAARGIEDQTGLSIQTSTVTCLLGADELETDGPTSARCDEVTRDVRRYFGEHIGDFTEIGRGVLEALLVFILAPLIALYVLMDLPQLQRDLLNLVPESHREEVRDLGNKVQRAFGGFLRGQLFVALTVGAMSALGFWIIGLPFWLLIGSIAGFFNLVPLVGPFIGGGLGFLVGTMTGGVGLGVAAAVVELIVQQVDNHVISPNVMRRTVQLHPATVMLALLAGGAISGVWGVLFGVPAVAVGKLVLGHLWATRVLGVEPTPFAHKRADGPPEVVPDGSEPG